LYVTSF